MSEKYATQAEFARLVGVSRAVIGRAIARGRIASVVRKAGRTLIALPAGQEEFLRGQDPEQAHRGLRPKGAHAARIAAANLRRAEAAASYAESRAAERLGAGRAAMLRELETRVIEFITFIDDAIPARLNWSHEETWKYKRELDVAREQFSTRLLEGSPDTEKDRNEKSRS